MIDFDYSEWAILRFIGASFVLWLCYYLLFDRKAPFNQCRNYLLFSVLLAGAVSVLRIPVYPVEVVKPVKMEQIVVVQNGYQKYFEENKERICDTDYTDETFETEKI